MSLIKGGIICDHCGTTYQDDFIYYSWDFYPVRILGGRKPSIQSILSSKAIISYDICPTCWDKLKNLVVNNYGKGNVCEITGVGLPSEYYYVVVTWVDVKISGQPNICTQCNNISENVNTPCKCGCLKFIKHAEVKTDRRILEFNTSSDFCIKLRESAEKFIKTIGQWEAKS